ncbi:aromatic-ring-hydroxylating dioxygenase subunit beta [Acidocella aquatica]|uniref:Aromatic-ring-hydroxylating dioxygenase subunit beta n=1 Tax=Acidocella aquatica TaxID=1922313 RepID=A0ABQ6A2P7_9PROT|nr:aromatic-ring-hydroxylating dioxygenase subunit beta [Acidocella aquatica]GLR65683.1 aromatic-ring-hydroxylating dioxygenase subunit beta [Acidocella aquatica]
MPSILTRTEAEDFLFHEAELLDDWRMPEWAALYTEGALYEVTSPASPDPVASNAANSLFLISDHIDRIRGRANRLMKKSAHAEFPRSKTRHLVTNVRIVGEEDGGTRLRANIAVYRTKEDTSTVFMGEAWYTIVNEGGTLKIHRKRIILDLNSLYNQGRLTIIL